jgi:hypothetical protein
MGASLASAAQSAAAETSRAREIRNGKIPDGEIRDVHLSGHFAGRPGRKPVVQVDAVELNLDDPELDPELKLALDYWRAKKGARLAPTRTDIDPVDIAPLLPQVMLVDIGDDPLDFRFRLAGTGIFKIHGAELTNKRALDLEPAPYAALIHGHYCEATARRAPVAHRVLIEVDARRSAYMRIILPLSEDGQAINRLMTVETYADCAQDLRDCFAEARLSA